MRRTAALGLATVADCPLAVVTAALVVTLAGPDRRPVPPDACAHSRTVPLAPASLDVAPVHLVADLDHVAVRESQWRRADHRCRRPGPRRQHPVVRPPDRGDGGGPGALPYDEGVALRRVAGVLGFAYAASHDPRYLDALAAQTVGASRWPDWNPGHPLDTAQVGTAVALGWPGPATG